MPVSEKSKSDVATASEVEMSKPPKAPRLMGLLLLFILAGSGFLYYVAISPQRFGRGHDDSVYVTTAKALATGEGYRIISLPYQPAQTKYPPFYPLLLS